MSGASFQALMASVAASGGGTPPLDGLSPTAAWSASRKLLTAYGGSFYSASSSLVDTLYDQSGNSRDVTASGSNRPTATTLDGRAALLFSSNGMTNAANMSSFITTTAGYMIATMQAVSFLNSGVGFAAAPIIQDSSSNAGMHVSSSAGGKFFADTWDGSGKHADVAILTGITYVVEWRHESGTLYARVNGTGETSVSAGTTVAMGNFNLGNSTLNAYILEAATFATVPTLTDRDAMVQSLGLYVGASV